MQTRRLGKTGPGVSALGLGCMGMSDAYGPADRKEAISTIHMALDHGITLFDTGDFYGMGDNEMLLREALAGRRDDATISVKAGMLRSPEGPPLGIDCRPAAMKTWLSYSLRRLGTDHIDIYRPARLDPQVPIEDTIGALADLVKGGYIRHIGLSEVSAATIKRAAAVHPLSDLQIEYSLLTRGVEDEIRPVLDELGMGLTAYGVLCRGLISGHWQANRPLTPDDYRAYSPRFMAENVEANLGLVERMRVIADDMGATVAQLAIAYVVAKGKTIVPLIGSRTRKRLDEALGALAFDLTDEQVSAIEEAVPLGAAHGTRYPEQHMGSLDSERSGAHEPAADARANR